MDEFLVFYLDEGNCEINNEAYTVFASSFAGALGLAAVNIPDDTDRILVRRVKEWE